MVTEAKKDLAPRHYIRTDYFFHFKVSKNESPSTTNDAEIQLRKRIQILHRYITPCFRFSVCNNDPQMILKNNRAYVPKKKFTFIYKERKHLNDEMEGENVGTEEMMQEQGESHEKLLEAPETFKSKTILHYEVKEK